LEDPNCSITNPTTFCIASNYLEQQVSTNPNDYQSYTVTIGTNNFNNTGNAITTSIKLSSDNSPIFDTNLLINVVNNNDLCYSVDNTVTAMFDSNSPYILLSKAINSKLYNVTNNSLLTFGEDVGFNNNYALGNMNALNKYYTQALVTNKLEPNNIAETYLPSTNKISVVTNAAKMDTNSFGSYKINVLSAKINVTNSNVNLLNNNILLIGNANNDDNNTNASELSGLNYYNSIFNDTSPDNSFQIKITTNNLNSGLNFTNSNDTQLFTIDNTTMINNIHFMKDIIYPNIPINVNLTQNPMTITPKQQTTIAYTANNALLSLTSNGEMLGNTEYNTNGEIKLEIMSIDERVERLSQTAGVFSKINVDYDYITDELKNNLNIRYEIKNIIIPTNAGQYGAFAFKNNASVYMSNANNIVSEISTSVIDSSDDEVILIKINPLNVLTNSLNGNKIYELNNYNPLVSQPINANIYVDISDDISILKEKYELRFEIVPKQINELNVLRNARSL
jgi:hypothetical protein